MPCCVCPAHLETGSFLRRKKNTYIWDRGLRTSGKRTYFNECFFFNSLSLKTPSPDVSSQTFSIYHKKTQKYIKFSIMKYFPNVGQWKYWLLYKDMLSLQLYILLWDVHNSGVHECGWIFIWNTKHMWSYGDTNITWHHFASNRRFIHGTPSNHLPWGWLWLLYLLGQNRRIQSGGILKLRKRTEFLHLNISHLLSLVCIEIDGLTLWQLPMSQLTKADDFLRRSWLKKDGKIKKTRGDQGKNRRKRSQRMSSPKPSAGNCSVWAWNSKHSIKNKLFQILRICWLDLENDSFDTFRFFTLIRYVDCHLKSAK